MTIQNLLETHPHYVDGWNRSVVWLIVGFYVFALLGACFPSWEGVALLIVLYCVSGLGVTVWYHRFFTHGSFETYPWVWALGAIAGMLSGEGPAIFWVGWHTLHHAKSDTADDPHSPHHGGFWHAHMLWLMAFTHPDRYKRIYLRYTPKWMLRSPFLMMLSHTYKYWHYGLIVLLAVFGFAYGWFARSEVFLWFRWETVELSPAWSAAYFALSFVGYGYFIRTVLILNATWSVNSASHLWGDQPYREEAGDDSRNNWWVALVTFGEGWHNNHHACPTAYSHGQRWYQIDKSAWCINIMALCGLAWNLKEFRLPPKRKEATVTDRD
jgi:fatty-acid desaturase